MASNIESGILCFADVDKQLLPSGLQAFHVIAAVCQYAVETITYRIDFALFIHYLKRTAASQLPEGCH